jgi:hypothetical protein
LRGLEKIIRPLERPLKGLQTILEEALKKPLREWAVS